MKIFFLILFSFPVFGYHSQAILDCRQSLSSTEFMSMLVMPKDDQGHPFEIKKFENGQVINTDHDQVEMNSAKAKLQFQSKKMTLVLETTPERALNERYFIGDLTMGGEHFDVSCEYFLP
jgi:hypothetical protein